MPRPSLLPGTKSLPIWATCAGRLPKRLAGRPPGVSGSGCSSSGAAGEHEARPSAASVGCAPTPVSYRPDLSLRRLYTALTEVPATSASQLHGICDVARFYFTGIWAGSDETAQQLAYFLHAASRD